MGVGGWIGGRGFIRLRGEGSGLGLGRRQFCVLEEFLHGGRGRRSAALGGRPSEAAVSGPVAVQERRGLGAASSLGTPPSAGLLGGRGRSGGRRRSWITVSSTGGRRWRRGRAGPTLLQFQVAPILLG